MLRRQKTQKAVDRLQGMGSVYLDESLIAEVTYDLTVKQEVVKLRRQSPPREIKGPKTVSGKLTTVGSGVIPLLRSVMVLELQDQRKLDFYVHRSIPHAYEYQYEIMGSGWLRDT
ncbi:MAG: hypothetical protein ACP5HS_12845 [Anaerolineae bacterium]